jgi:hypothetical protein
LALRHVWCVDQYAYWSIVLYDGEGGESGLRLASVVLSGEFMGIDIGYMFDDSNRIVHSGLLDSSHIVVAFCGMHD